MEYREKPRMTLRFWSEQLEGESVHIPTWEGQYHGEIKCAAWTPQVEMPVRYPRVDFQEVGIGCLRRCLSKRMSILGRWDIFGDRLPIRSI